MNVHLLRCTLNLGYWLLICFDVVEDTCKYRTTAGRRRSSPFLVICIS